MSDFSIDLNDKIIDIYKSIINYSNEHILFSFEGNIMESPPDLQIQVDTVATRILKIGYFLTKDTAEKFMDTLSDTITAFTKKHVKKGIYRIVQENELYYVTDIILIHNYVKPELGDLKKILKDIHEIIFKESGKYVLLSSRGGVMSSPPNLKIQVDTTEIKVSKIGYFLAEKTAKDFMSALSDTMSMCTHGHVNKCTYQIISEKDLYYVTDIILSHNYY